MAYKHATALKNLENEQYIFITDSQDIQAVLDYVSLPLEYQKDITGAVIVLNDGDYDAVWLSESSRPYDLSSNYYALPFYRDEDQNNEFIPYYWNESNEYYTV